MAVIDAYTINIKKIAGDTNAVSRSVLSSQKAIQNINSAMARKTRIRSEIFKKRQELNRRRLENESRKEQEDVIEYSKMSSISKTPSMALARTGKSFLGRIMDFISNLAIGWLLYNLPTWIGMATEFIKRAQKLGSVIQNIVSYTLGTLTSIGTGLVNVVSDIVRLDFGALPNDVTQAFNGFQSNIDKMGQQFEEGFKLFSTGLDKSLTGTEIPQVGTQQQEQPYEPVLTPSFGAGTREQKAFSYFKSQGYTNEQAAAIVGNLKQENRALDPNVVNSIGRRGIAQWDEGRWRNLQNFARRSGLDPNAFETQLMFIQEELRTGAGGMKSSTLKAQTTLEGATVAFRRGYERPSEAEAMDVNRIRFAREVLAAGGTSVTTQQAPNVTGSGGKVIEYLTGDRTSPRYRADHAAGNYHDHLAFDSQRTRDAAMRFLVGKGWTIGSVNTGRHASGSYHYTNQAFDIPFYPNQSRKGVSDDAKGETALSSKLRADLIAGGFNGSQLSGGAISSPSPATVAGTGQYSQTAAGLTPGDTGEQIDIVIPDTGLTPAGGGGGGSAAASSPAQIMQDNQATVLNNFVKNHLLVELAYL